MSVAATPPGTRVYAIGDIHGRRDLLLRLHELEDLGRNRERELHSLAAARHLQRLDEGAELRIVLTLQSGEGDDAVQHATQILGGLIEQCFGLGLVGSCS